MASVEAVRRSTAGQCQGDGEPTGDDDLGLWVDSDPYLLIEGSNRSGLYHRRLKRLLDIAGSIALALILAPVALTTAVAVRVALGRGVIYRQRRTGLDGVPFTMLKFRTLDHDRRIAQVPFEGVDRRVCHKREDDPRHTPLGRFLRRSSLDEIPQLWNVLRGQMSLVGPRPELCEVVDRYEPWQHLRHVVKPGLTGFWQVSKRAGGLAYEAVELDLEYIRKVSLVTDCKVLLRTIPITVRRTGR